MPPCGSATVSLLHGERWHAPCIGWSHDLAFRGCVLRSDLFDFVALALACWDTWPIANILTKRSFLEWVMRIWYMCVHVQVFFIGFHWIPPVALRLKMNLSHVKADAWHHHRASQTAKKMPVKTNKNDVTSGATRRICIMIEHFHSGCLPKGIVMVDRTAFPKTRRTDGKMRWIHSMYCQWNHHTTLGCRQCYSVTHLLDNDPSADHFTYDCCSMLQLEVFCFL